jgi:protein-S-isoprenylcysteine O-methyltransferase Ste14
VRSSARGSLNLHVLALTGILPAAATFYFYVFWRWFDFWRRHRVLTYSLMFGSFAVLGVAVHANPDVTYSYELRLPVALRAMGWALIGSATLFALVADRQIGLRVRSFAPFFEPHGKIRLCTRGAYGVVRHPIYSAGIAYQLGVFLVTGVVAVLLALAVFGLGALWFTRQEEQRLLQLLDDPTEYERYRRKVPALFPRVCC